MSNIQNEIFFEHQAEIKETKGDLKIFGDVSCEWCGKYWLGKYMGVNICNECTANIPEEESRGEDDFRMSESEVVSK